MPCAASRSRSARRVRGPDGTIRLRQEHPAAAVGGLDRPTSGEVVLDGEVVSHLSDRDATRLRREKTGFVFQFFNLIPLLDVYENVALPFTIAGVDPRHGDAAARIKDVLEHGRSRVGRERNRPDQLSAGEQQRVALARALVGSRRSCSPTSRPATSTTPPAARSSMSCGAPATSAARRSSS
jgi:putative ABC transport system ATP-binding protein